MCKKHKMYTNSRGISPRTIVSIPIVLRQINLSEDLKVRNIYSIDLEWDLDPVIKYQIKVSFIKLCVFNLNHLWEIMRKLSVLFEK